MARKQELHGAALNNSKYAPYVAYWLAKDTRLTAGAICKRLVDEFGLSARFSEPTVKKWMENYYPEIVKVAITHAQIAPDFQAAIVSVSESRLFGKISDQLTYLLNIRNLLEDKIGSLKSDFESLETSITELSKPIEVNPDFPDEAVATKLAAMQLRMKMIQLKVQLQAKLKDGVKELRELNRQIDEFQRTHDFGERMGDILEKMIMVVYEKIMPFVQEDYKLSVRKDFDSSWRDIGAEFGVPASKVLG